MSKCITFIGGYAFYGQVITIPTEETLQGGDTLFAISSRPMIATLSEIMGVQLPINQITTASNLTHPGGGVTKFFVDLERSDAALLWEKLAEHGERYRHDLEDYSWSLTGWGNNKGVTLTIQGDDTLIKSRARLSDMVKVSSTVKPKIQLPQ